jgi:hypothetical protein
MNSKPMVFYSKNKRRKEILLVTLGMVLIAGSIWLWTWKGSIPITVMLALPILAFTVFSATRSIKYTHLRAEICERACSIYANEQIVAEIPFSSLKPSYYGQGGLKLRFAQGMTIARRMQLAGLFFHFFGPCVRHIVLPNRLFPDIGQLAQASKSN